MVTITRKNLEYCNFSSDNENELKISRQALQVYVDGAFFSELYKKGKWDGYHKFFTKQDDFYFGLAEDLIFHLEQKSIDWEYKDEYSKTRHKIIFDVSERQRDYQNSAIREFFKSNIGIVIVPTRGGKTFLASETISRTLKFNDSYNTLFIVDTVDLFKQAIGDISGYLGINKDEIGTINDKGINPDKITVAMAQTLVARIYPIIRKTRKIKGKDTPYTFDEIKAKKKEKNAEKRKLEKYLYSVRFLIVDEIQDQSSKKRFGVFKKCKNLKQKMGLSATPFKQGGEINNIEIKGFFGGVCYTIPKKELQDKGYLSLDKVLCVSYDHSEYSRRNRHFNLETYREHLTNSIHHNDERNQILYDIISRCKKDRFKTLVLFNSVEHGKIISKLTGCKFISGETDNDERNDVKEYFLRGRGKILMASNIFKKGITLPEVEVLVLADGGLEGANIEQKQGRVLGAVEGKESCAIIDIMDVGVKYFSEHSLNRLEIFSGNVSKDRLEVYEDYEIELLMDSVKEWLK